VQVEVLWQFRVVLFFFCAEVSALVWGKGELEQMKIPQGNLLWTGLFLMETMGFMHRPVAPGLALGKTSGLESSHDLGDTSRCTFPWGQLVCEAGFPEKLRRACVMTPSLL
jgi:hypothetical protein